MKIKTALVIFLLPIFTIAQTAVVTGKVVNGNGEAVSMANIFITSLGIGAGSSENGQFRLELPYGSYRVEVSSIGFKSIAEDVEVYQEEVSLNFVLTEKSEELETVEINDKDGQTSVYNRLKSIEGVAIYAAKKNEVLELSNISANLASNNARQVFARVPGVVVWENDCAGLQLGIGARGLSPDRTSNFNTRQNGYDMAADALGYPESYYAPPMQAIDRIEIVRGAASLQYGTQFGGMINLKLKRGDPHRRLTGSTVNTYNSLGYFNTFNELGGQTGKVNYYGFVNYRGGNGNRPHTQFDTYTTHISLGYQFTPKLEVIGEYTRMNYLAQQPGGLTDFEFEKDPYQSLRSRNWFTVDWNLAAIRLNYQLNQSTVINSRTFALVGSRKALGFLSPPNRLDLEPFVNRDLLVDHYRNIGHETRLLHRYKIDGRYSAFLGGVRLYRGYTEKTQGFGSKATGPDFEFESESLKLLSDYSFPSYNLAAFTENIFAVTDRLTITPGVRFELIQTHAKGFYDSSVRIPHTGEVVIDSTTSEERQNLRTILLGGVGAAYQLPMGLELYANISQNYRAITFNDMRVVRPSTAVDPHLQDERGFNVDMGVRGSLTEGLTLDAGLFWLSYQNRIGSILTRVTDEYFGERLVRLTTNVADAEIYGLESYFEAELLKLFRQKSDWKASVFLNLALIKAYYHSSSESAIEDNRVENVPVVNFKSGFQGGYKDFNASLQFTYLSDQFSEATNAVSSPDGTYGIIPSYWVMDLSMDYKFRWLKVETGINNLTDNAYFTRRANGYPGPGIIPSAPRHFYLGLGLTF